MAPDHISETIVFLLWKDVCVGVSGVLESKFYIQSSESSGVGSPLHPPLTMYLNNSILQVSSFLEF